MHRAQACRGPHTCLRHSPLTTARSHQRRFGAELTCLDSYNCPSPDSGRRSTQTGEQRMYKVSQMMGALVGAILISGCDTSGPLPTAPASPSTAARSISATGYESSLKDQSDAQIVTASGDITPAVNQFRTLLGPLRANVAGDSAGGRREINWDGVPATLTNNDLFPGTF